MSNNVTCPNCRLVNFATAQVCRNCGTPLIAPTNWPSMAEARFAAGIDFLNRGQYREAIDAFIYAIQSNYYPAESYHYLSQAYAALGYTKEAEEAYYRAASLRSSYAALAASPAPAAVENVEYAGFWIRVLANFMDSILMMVISLPFAFLIQGSSYLESPEPPTINPLHFLISQTLSAAAIIFCWLRWSATPGKMAISVYIVDAKTGGKPSTGQLIGRYFAYLLSALPLGYGFIHAAFNSKKQTWHDKLAGTVVIRKRTTRQVGYGYGAQAPTSSQTVGQKSPVHPILAGLLVYSVVAILSSFSLRLIKTSEKLAAYKSEKNVSASPYNPVPEAKPAVKPPKPAPASIPPRLPYYAYLSFDSDKDHLLGAGEYKKLTPEDGQITASVTKEGLVVISFQGGTESWEVELAAPGGLRVNKETYEGAESNSGPNSDKPVLNLKRNGSSCATAKSRYVVHDIAYKSNNELELLDATFEQRCEGTEPRLYGRVYYENKPNRPEAKIQPAGIPPRLDSRRYISLSSNKPILFNYRRQITYNSDNGFSSEVKFNSVVIIRYLGGIEGMIMNLIPPQGTKLTPGSYDQIETRPTGNKPGMDISLTGVSCYQAKGRLVIEDIIYGKNNNIDLLDATFELQCPGSNATVYGRIYYDKR